MRPEARRRAQQTAAHRIADGLADYFFDDDRSADEAGPRVTPPPPRAAFADNARRAFVFPGVLLAVAVAVVGGVVWGVFAGRR